MKLTESTQSAGRRFRRAAMAIGCSAMFAVVGAGIALAAPVAGAASAAPAADDTPACPIQPAGNARYLAWVYQKVLYRCPDQGGLDYWTNQLNNGRSRASVVIAIDNSYENLYKNNVEALFKGVLQREPTQAEIDTWIPKFKTERADADLFATLYSSDAFWNSPALNADPATYVAFLYDAVLDRVGDQTVADPQGFGYYTSILGSAPTQAQRYTVAMDFESSTANMHDWVWASYQASLGRLPDPSGGVYWTEWLLSHNEQTFDMCNRLEASQEAYNDAQNQQNPPPEPPH